MRKAVQTAEGIYLKFGCDLERIARKLGLIVLEEELAGRLSEVYFGDAIVVKRDLPRAVKRELIAHAIGHHLMHAGNHLTLQDNTYSFGNYHERQANVFAAWLLVPEEELSTKLEAGKSIPDLAHDFGVTDELMLFRLQLRHLAGGGKGKTAGQGHETLDGD
jgi:Zn-dependent peptidase ImmA (M78 family)